MSTSDSGKATATDTEIGKRILAALAYRQVSQKAFAKEVGINYDRFRQITKGERAMDLLEYRCIILALDFGPAELIAAAA
jgi:hypothetical protein